MGKEDGERRSRSTSIHQAVPGWISCNSCCRELRNLTRSDGRLLFVWIVDARDDGHAAIRKRVCWRRVSNVCLSRHTAVIVIVSRSLLADGDRWRRRRTPTLTPTLSFTINPNTSPNTNPITSPNTNRNTNPNTSPNTNPNINPNQASWARAARGSSSSSCSQSPSAVTAAIRTWEPHICRSAEPVVASCSVRRDELSCRTTDERSAPGSSEHVRPLLPRHPRVYATQASNPRLSDLRQVCYTHSASLASILSGSVLSSHGSTGG